MPHDVTSLNAWLRMKSRNACSSDHSLVIRYDALLLTSFHSVELLCPVAARQRVDYSGKLLLKILLFARDDAIVHSDRNHVDGLPIKFLRSDLASGLRGLSVDQFTKAASGVNIQAVMRSQYPMSTACSIVLRLALPYTYRLNT